MFLLEAGHFLGAVFLFLKTVVKINPMFKRLIVPLTLLSEQAHGGALRDPTNQMLSTLSKVNEVLGKEVDTLSNTVEKVNPAKKELSSGNRFKGSCDCLICPGGGANECEPQNSRVINNVEQYECTIGRLNIDGEARTEGRCMSIGETMKMHDKQNGSGGGGGATKCKAKDEVTCDTCKAVLQGLGEQIGNSKSGCDFLGSNLDYLKIWNEKADTALCDDQVMSEENIQTLEAMNRGWLTKAYWPNQDATGVGDKALVSHYNCAMLECCTDFPEGYYAPFKGAVCHSDKDPSGIFTEVVCSESTLSCPASTKTCPLEGIGSQCDHSCFTGKPMYLGSTSIESLDSLHKVTGLAEEEEAVVCCQKRGEAVRRVKTSECTMDRQTGQSVVDFECCMQQRSRPTSACTDESIKQDQLLTWAKDPARQVEDQLFYLRARQLRDRELNAEKERLEMLESRQNGAGDFGGSLESGHDENRVDRDSDMNPGGGNQLLGNVEADAEAEGRGRGSRRRRRRGR